MPKETVPMQLLDKRVVERNIKKGLVTRETFDKHLGALPDVATQAETIQARLGAEDEADEDVSDEGDEEGAEENG